MKEVVISPITRLEGHGKITIFLDDAGNVADAYFQVVELRGFERFCIGRPVEELPRITPRICGVCPWAHHMASSKACDAVYKTEPTPAAKKIREMAYCAHMMHSHQLHFYALAAPDFIVGAGAPKAERNVLGLIQKVGLETGKLVIKNRGYAQRIQEIVGGKATHPVCGVPGGVSKPLSEEERAEIEEKGKALLEFGKTSLEIFDNLVLKNKELVDLIAGDIYYHETYYMGLVDKNNKVNFYEGDVRVVDPEGREYAKFSPDKYLDYIAEHVEPWSYLKFPYLKGVGWKGLVDGKDSGVYRVNTLARLNVADGMATPLAQEAYEKFYEFFGRKPVHNTLAFHWARLIENLYAAERLMELVQDPEITSKDVRAELGEPEEGVGCVEAPRGTLFHHYWTDEEGIVTKLNLIVATGQNNAAICMSIKKAAQKLIKGGEVNDKLLNMVEMAFRAYDPCLACATHTLPGQMPLEVLIYDADGNLVERLTRNI
ncbi:MAG TPA: Ni/Fe hydrogenase subunit alpha [Methanomicrobia archaeon]|nr:Ni/Fe hydrogenase subunit alpha [Methanomicrobia archaeon]HEX59994.1 Ni/Fe hydrogenase subunit alpha [Methanomicrobia archaeon]